jgi:hypothetical protein
MNKLKAMIGWTRENIKRQIRVILVPTNTYTNCSHGCDLQKIADQLNECQDCYEFVVPILPQRWHTSETGKVGVALRKRKELVRAEIRLAAPKSLSERKKAVSTYISDADAFEQVLAYLEYGGDRISGRPFNHNDIVIVVGGEVIVSDAADNEFEGDAAWDAFSCQWIGENIEEDGATDGGQAIGILEDNNTLTPLQQFSMVSLRRATLIFPEIMYTDNIERARSIISRYIIYNAVFFVGNRSFGRTVLHHDMTNCLNESNWTGGERDSYYVDGYCQRCQNIYEEAKVVERYRQWSFEQLITALREMLKVPDQLDATVRSTEKASLWMNLAFVAIALNIFDAWIMDVALIDFDHEASFWPIRIRPHWPALTLAVLACVSAGIYLWRYFRRRRQLP